MDDPVKRAGEWGIVPGTGFVSGTMPRSPGLFTGSSIPYILLRKGVSRTVFHTPNSQKIPSKLPEITGQNSPPGPAPNPAAAVSPSARPRGVFEAGAGTSPRVSTSSTTEVRGSRQAGPAGCRGRVSTSSTTGVPARGSRQARPPKAVGCICEDHRTAGRNELGKLGPLLHADQ